MDKVFDIFAYLMGKAAGGGGDVTVESKSISSNGTFTAPPGKAYSPVTVDVPNSYAAGDEGKVVSNGELVAQSSDSVTQNGTVDTTLINSVVVNVSGGAVDWDGFADGSWPTGDVVLGTGITSIPDYSFQGRKGITSFNASMVTSIGSDAFRSCTALESVNLPEVTTIGSYAFQWCSRLSGIFPKAVTVGIYAFNVGSSEKWATIVLPACTSLGADCFRGTSTRYEAIDLGPGVKSLSNRTFYQGVFHDIILRCPTVVTCGNVNALYGTSASTKFFVPQALISSYEAASNWSSVMSSNGFSFVAIEGSQYENYYADGTPIPTT